MTLSGRTVLITGGTSGIGLGLAEVFYNLKSTVIVCGRNLEKLAGVEKKYPGIITMICDVGDARQRENMAGEVMDHFPDLDILVNNAGIQRYLDLKRGYEDLKTGEDEITINFTSIVELTALLIKHLMKRPSAAIINVGSGLGLMPMVNTPVYSATKAAIHTYSLVLRQQLKETPVKIIEIIPPMVDTGLNKQGRDAASLSFRGISLAQYIPTVVKGLEDDNDMIFYGDAEKIMSAPRGEMETRLLKSSW
jgi:uncharacterized oxidoreductase